MMTPRSVRAAAPRAAIIAAAMAACLLSARATASAEDADGRDPAPPPPVPGAPRAPSAPAPAAAHPLQRLRGEMLRAAHRAAHRIVLEIASAQSRAMAIGSIDADNDGTGEAGVFQELANAIDHVHDATERPRFGNPMLPPAFGSVDANGVVVRGGYCYRMWLPGKGRTFVSETPGARDPGSDPEASETQWGLYAWPLRYGATGRFTFFVNRDATLVADVPAYSGAAQGPAPASALAAPDPPGWTGAPGFPALDTAATPGEQGVDGQVWRDATSVQPSELDAAPPPRIAVWRDEKLLAEALAEACDAVAAAAGSPFDAEHGGRPTARFATVAEVAAVVEAESGAVMSRFGVPAEGRRSATEFSAGAMIAKYATATHAILVVPETAELAAQITGRHGLDSRDAVRVLLLHEVSHAQTMRRFPLLAAAQAAASQEEFLAMGAVIEGHAQWLAAKAARAKGLSEAFEAFSASVSFVPKGAGEPQDAMLRVLAAGAAFPYIQGRRFFDAVEAARGPAGVEEALRDPPRDVRMIERPVRWIERKERAGRLSAAQRMTTLFGTIVPADWSVVPQPMTMSHLRATAAALLGEPGAACIDALDDVRVTAASRGSDMLVVAAMAFDDEASAQSFLAVERAMQTAQDTNLPASAAGVIAENPEGGRPGFTVRRRFQQGAVSVGTVVWVARVGAVVVEVSLAGNALPESKVEETLAKAAAAAAPPEEKR